MRPQAIALAQRPHVVIATPGRLADHIKTSGEDTIAGLRRVKMVVLDEADRLLASGQGSMLPDVETCLSCLPPSSERQTLLFTATLTAEVRALKSMPRPEGKPPIFVTEVSTENQGNIPPTLKQTYLKVPMTHREAFLHVLLSTEEKHLQARHHLLQPHQDRRSARTPFAPSWSPCHLSSQSPPSI
jgi:Superfamily II DNA and RNA helicases